MSAATDPFLTALRQTRLFDPAELAELTAWADASLADTQAIVAELLRRGRLTPYQAREVHRGRGAALTLGRYVLLDKIGEGGMGRVYKARDTRLGREVALKVIRMEKLARPNVLHRFHQEMQAAGKLAHPNVVLALDAGEANGTHFIAMEFVEGIDLTRLVQSRGPLAIPQACDYVRQAATGLQHAAEQSLVHRDVKPSNLFVTPRGQVKVLDLGLAMLKGETGNTRVTHAGLVLGTPDFLAPEQARDPLGVDTRADVYALGATLYYLLTGRPPFDAPSPAEKVVQHVTAPPPSAQVRRPDVPPQLDTVIQWMMAKRPEDRPQTPALAALALAPFCAPPGQPVVYPEPPAPVPVSAEPPVERRHSRRTSTRGLGLKVAALAVGLVGLVAIAGATFVLIKGRTGPTRADAAEFTNSVGMKMVRLPGGEGPLFVSAHEVTHGQFLSVMGKSPARHPPKMRHPNAVPVDSVTWEEANEFCRRLTAKERGQWAYRLPTEAEWEYACRAGTETPFWSGESLVLGEHAIFDGEPTSGRQVERNTPHPVGSTAANPFGLFDTHGNVWEWCASPADGGQRVARGGSWREPAARCRSSARRLLDAASRESDVGFRVVSAPR
jgi:formylglycine-generating enzyme required for sulfatase activity